MPTFCSSCEASNPKTARFCEACGAPMAADVEDTPPPRARRSRHVGFVVLLFGGTCAIARARSAFPTSSAELRAEQPSAPLVPMLERAAS